MLFSKEAEVKARVVLSKWAKAFMDGHPTATEAEAMEWLAKTIHDTPDNTEPRMRAWFSRAITSTARSRQPSVQY